MLNITEHVCLIENEEDLVRNVEAAQELLQFAEAQGNKDEVQWVFESGYFNNAHQTVTAVFKGRRAPGSNGYLLSVVAHLDAEGIWRFKIDKKEMH
jgi:hypothetical protein